MKTILDIITKAGANGAALIAFLEDLKVKFPDLAPEAQVFINALSATADPAVLAGLAATITTELGAVAQLHFSGHTHAGDGA